MRQHVVVGLFALILIGSCSSNGGSKDSSPLYLDTWVYPDRPRYDAKADSPVSCGEQSFEIARTTPDMLIVLDRSNSMGIGATPLWDSSRTAIYDVTSAMDQQVWFGLFVFPNSVGTSVCQASPEQNVCTAPSEPVVKVAASTSGAIKSSLTSMAVCGGTPTAATLTAAKQYLQTLAGDNHPKYIVLATDGGPNCNTALDPSTCTCVAKGACPPAFNCLDDVATFKVLDDLFAASIKTFVVGLGGDAALANVLPGLAQHGWCGSGTGCTGTPYAPSDAAAIKKAFTDITNTVTSCDFTMDCSKIPDPGLVNFYFDGNVVSFDNTKQSGWAWTTPCVKGQAGTGKMSFFGKDCDNLKSGAVKSVSAKFGCPTHLM